MDSLVFEDSINSEFHPSDFVSKQWLYVNDNNNSNYQSQIVLDTTALSNSGGYIGWAESFLAIPLIITLSSDNVALLPHATPIDYFVGLKNGFWQILHSAVVEFNNTNVVQQVPFLNVFTSFKNLTSWSLDDLKNHSMSCGFYPDDSDSWIFNDTDNLKTRVQASYGQGLSNTRNAQRYYSTSTSTSTFVGTQAANPLPTPYTPAGTVTTDTTTTTIDGTVNSANPQSKWNRGFRQRQEWLSYDPENTSFAQQGKLLSQANASQIYKSFIDNSIDGAKRIKLVAKVRLADICDFFKQLPLLKGSTMRIYLNTNQAQSKIKITPNGGANEYNIMTVEEQTLQNGTNPLMLAPVSKGMGGQPLADAIVAAGKTDATYYVNVSIYKNSFPQPTGYLGWGDSTQLSSVRLYAPNYVFNPISEQRYLSLTPTKKVIYRDIFQYSFPKIQGQSNFNFLVTNGISNLKSVLVVPLLNPASNGANATNVGTLQSPFSATGGMPDPIALTNFNIQVSGRNLFINNEIYDFEQFMEQLRSSNQLNGNLTKGLTSGLIGEYEFTSGYRYYYGDCSRSSPTEDGVAKAVQLLGVVDCPNTIYVDLLVFCEFERAITIDLRTGAKIE
jgi:hypothetical protein